MNLLNAQGNLLEDTVLSRPSLGALPAPVSVTSKPVVSRTTAGIGAGGMILIGAAIFLMLQRRKRHHRR